MTVYTLTAARRLAELPAQGAGFSLQGARLALSGALFGG
jgi:hypothetical protein